MTAFHRQSLLAVSLFLLRKRCWLDCRLSLRESREQFALLSRSERRQRTFRNRNQFGVGLPASSSGVILPSYGRRSTFYSFTEGAAISPWGSEQIRNSEGGEPRMNANARIAIWSPKEYWQSQWHTAAVRRTRRVRWGVTGPVTDTEEGGGRRAEGGRKTTTKPQETLAEPVAHSPRSPVPSPWPLALTLPSPGGRGELFSFRRPPSALRLAVTLPRSLAIFRLPLSGSARRRQWRSILSAPGGSKAGSAHRRLL